MTWAVFLLMLLPQAVRQEEVYLTEEQALQVVFGEASVTKKEVTLGSAEKASVEKKLGRKIAEKQLIYVGTRDKAVIGYAMITEEIGKYLPITFIVGVTPEGAVSEVAVMVHREHIGSDCRKKRFIGQFKGKTRDSSIRNNKDILVVQGATLSCNGVARGVRRVLSLVSAAFPQEAQPVREKRMRMGTLCTIAAEGVGAKEAVDAAFKEIQKWDDILSNYKKGSELAQLNQKKRIPGSKDFRAFLIVALKLAEETKGMVDITIGGAVQLWGFPDKKYRVPSEEELNKVVTGYKRVTVTEEEILMPIEMQLDPGAIGKGFAVDRAVAVLKKAGIQEGLVDFGSVVYGFGKKWDIAVRNPYEPDKTYCTVQIQDEALAVSGNYEKYFEKDGVRYAHIIDPRTKKPVPHVVQACVISKTATEADVYSTAVFVDRSFVKGRAALRMLPITFSARSRTPEWDKHVKGE